MRLQPGDIVKYAMPIEGSTKGVVTKIDGADVYLDVNLRGKIIGIHRLINEVRK